MKIHHCPICLNNLFYKVSLLQYFHYQDCICESCRNEMIASEKWIQVEDINVYCLYFYNRFMESLLFQFKDGRDIALKEVFFYRHTKYIESSFKGYTIVYMPSSKEHLERRRFFPLKEMLENISLDKMELFEKKETYKQSSQTYEKRKKIKEVLTLKENVTIPSKILLVDDVITSGQTILSAYRFIEKKAETIKILVLCDNTQSVELCDGKKFPIPWIVDILKKK